MCKYTYLDGTQCRLNPWHTYDYCLLHGDNYGTVKKHDDFPWHEEFQQAFLANAHSIVLEGIFFPKDCDLKFDDERTFNFKNCTFYGDVKFSANKSKLKMNAEFNGCIIKNLIFDRNLGALNFIHTEVHRQVRFSKGVNLDLMKIDQCPSFARVLLETQTNSKHISIDNSHIQLFQSETSGINQLRAKDSIFEHLVLNNADETIISSDNCTVLDHCLIQGKNNTKPIRFHSTHIKNDLIVSYSEQISEFVFRDTGRLSSARSIMIRASKLSRILSILHSEIDDLKINLSNVAGYIHLEHLRSESLEIEKEDSSTNSLYKELKIIDSKIHKSCKLQNFKVANLSFNNNQVFEKAIFENMQIIGSASFDETTFHKNVSFACSTSYNQEDDVVFGITSFSNTRFKGDVDFSNRVFGGALTFHNTQFQYAPNFSDATLCQHVTIDTAQFLDIQQKNVNQNAVERYRTLKFKMEELRDRRSQGMFFRCEQIALRLSGRKSKTETLISILYGISSDYGMNLGRPLLLILATYAIFFYINWIAYIICDLSIATKGFWNIFFHSLYETLKPIFVPFYGLRTSAACSPVTIFGILQSLVTYSLLALFFISLRWRFKKD